MSTQFCPMSDDTQQLLIEQACRRTLVRAAAAADAGDAAALAELFTSDAQLQRPGASPLHGRAAIEAAYAQRPAQRLTRHLLTNMQVEIQTPDLARATSLVLLWSGNRDDPPGPHGRPADARQVVGEFHDLLQRTPEGWRIRQRLAHFILHAGE
jgi:uncharacterized protein (TIGR02246 family)